MKLVTIALSLAVGSLALSGCDARHAAPGSTERTGVTVSEAPSKPPVADAKDPAASDKTVPAADVKVVETKGLPKSGKSASAKPTDSKSSDKSSSAKSDGKGLKVRRLVVAKGVEKREPEGVASSFWKDDFDRLYAFVEVDNAEKTKEKLTVSFIPPGGGAPRGNVSLDVGASPRWRTWAYSRAVDRRGTWEAVVTSEDGTELAREKFEIL